jgi:hypothetical protein
MKLAKFERKGFFALLCIFMMSLSLAGADAIVLKNGNRIEADRVWEEDGDIKCDQYGGWSAFQRERSYASNRKGVLRS